MVITPLCSGLSNSWTLSQKKQNPKNKQPELCFLTLMGPARPRSEGEDAQGWDSPTKFLPESGGPILTGALEKAE